MPENVQLVLHVSPQGKDDNPGTREQPFRTPGRAKQAVRETNRNQTGDIVVYLHEGVYEMTETLSFDQRDSGSNGHQVIYRAYPGEKPIMSGGRKLGGWRKVNHPVLANLWMAEVPGNAHTRHLYVNGRRAEWAKGPVVQSVAWDLIVDPHMEFYNLLETVTDFQGEKKVYEGYRATGAYTAMANWGNVGDIEFVYDVGWTHCILPVDRVTPLDDGSSVWIRMKQPAFRDAQIKGGVQIGAPNYIRNAFELLSEPGEWYQDRSKQTIYYIPRDDEDMESAETIVPVLERLLELKGTLDEPVSGIRFEGISFRHSTFLRPSVIGHAEIQANFVKNPAIDLHHTYDLKTPSALVLDAARSVVFEGCEFECLGSGAIDIQNGSCHNTVRGCCFVDIAASAVQIGDVNHKDAHPEDERTTVRHNTVANNVFRSIGVEYKGSVAVLAGYTDGTVIAHNDIAHVAYSGISVGWGWGVWDQGGREDEWAGDLPRYDKPTVARNNRIEYNRISQVMERLNDGAGIYTLSMMPGSVIKGNLIHDNGEGGAAGDETGDIPDRSVLHKKGFPGGIYLDEGSGGIEITANIVYNVVQAYFYHVQKGIPGRKDTVRVHGNYLNVSPADRHYPHDAAALAGLEEPYRHLLACAAAAERPISTAKSLPR
ncbi:right-handed parallel beta-helix repeat-containing protein [Paenibacillus cymbidii]|uniref:right-handed parallel beta-helix repeat-containing protein n=1 Tax=Paenibacillus cymbidii TaxID=1639034 RepID=UPI0014369208|nr:right-handed parallel beta-helix repeat-containing protein [Paenibacillus cymbidii]